MKLNIQDTFNKELPADENQTNSRRQVFEACFSYTTPRTPSNPELLHVSDSMLNALDLDSKDVKSKIFLDVFSGAKVLENTQPYAMCYGGHQFGQWAGQLGDGRATNLCEVVHNEQRWALQLKGAGATPYSRSADGLAVLRSSIREHLCSEAMHYLGVPTTRSLSLAITGDKVMRDMLYDGNAAYEKGAVVCRVSPSFIRFGNFQIFAARRDEVNLRKLADYTIRHFFPEITIETNEKYIALFQIIANRTLEMVLHWQRVGFVHGVMNTDNMSILGLTIDYGPYGWLEGYEPDWTPNTTDASHRRYRFGQQASVALWNLAQLGSALVTLVGEAKPFQSILEQYQRDLPTKYLEMMRSKLGLKTKQEGDADLVQSLINTLQIVETDMTIFFRNLAKFSKNEKTVSSANFLNIIKEAFYHPNDLSAKTIAQWTEWFAKYLKRLQQETATDEQRKELMNGINPKYVLRNYMAQLAIEKADTGDYTLIDELYQMLKMPYEEQPEAEKWFAKRPEWAREKVGCSMLSCSS